MDAAEYEGDIQLQKASSSLLADFDSSLKPFLWKTLCSGEMQARRRVRVMEKDRLLRLLAPFQELPQLLDPYLEKFLPALAEAYLVCLRGTATSKKGAENATLLIPLSTAICELLYTFCKIRGEKVVVRFLNAEPRHLELLLSAVEAAEATLVDGPTELDASSHPRPWTWEERYICLLWLSHLLLAPFDLATISSSGTAEINKAEIPDLTWPENLPGVTLRVVPLAVRYLASAGKERDAAKALLVRISLRKDMQELGLLHALVQWALSHLQSSTLIAINSTYYSIGILSYLGGLLVSSVSTLDMNAYLAQVFRVVQAISEGETAAFKNMYSSALARKTVIKIMRATAVIALQRKNSLLREIETTEMVEATIGHLLGVLADNDTPVRLAASKALSIITLKLNPIMATQVVDAVIDSLGRNVLWVPSAAGEDRDKKRDVSAVDPLEWHGLILTLSHLLYRRSPPPESLREILDALLLALSFEQRSTSGSSIGTNVRDAACFGIWAAARRYTTAELQDIFSKPGFIAKQGGVSLSALQILATELVVSASLDPAGNIRRGASAALQELIGRHPDTVAEGIAIVQVVDYHAVALRSRAMLEVAPKAASLSKYYENALLGALFTWRGVGDGDSISRKNAAAGVGLLSKGFPVEDQNMPWARVINLMIDIEQELNSLKAREIDRRHGLLMSMAAVISSVPDILNEENVEQAHNGTIGLRELIGQIFQMVVPILQTAKMSRDRRIELIAEGVSRIILSMAALIRTDLLLQAFASKKVSNIDAEKPALPCLKNLAITSKSSVSDILLSVRELDVCFMRGYSFRQDVITLAVELLTNWLRRTEKEVIDVATEAAATLMLVVDSQHRTLFVIKWIPEVLETSGRLPPGYIFVLAAVFPVVDTQLKDRICQALLQRWHTITDIENRITILQGLTQGCLLESHASRFVNMIADGLDDYTTDGRGDVGSLVRVEALKAARKAFESIPWDDIEGENKGSILGFKQPDNFSTLYGKVLRLSAEKLDRVRIEAQQTLAQVCRNEGERQRFGQFTISSYDYFRWLLELQTHDWVSLPWLHYQPSQWGLELFEGLVSSADTGSEDLIRVSRSALTDFCECERQQGDILPNQIEPKFFVCKSLLEVAKRNISNDRVLVPTLEVVNFLFDAGIMQQSNLHWRSLYLLVQKAHYKTGNVRKIEAAIKIYGSLTQVYPEALEKLTSMLLHPFPIIRNQVADMLFVVRGVGKGVDWTRAGKQDLKKLKAELERLGEK